MNKLIYFSLHLLLLLVAIGCTQDEQLLPPDEVGNEKTTLLIGFKTPQLNVLSRADMGADKEREIISMAVFIFDGDGNVVSKTFHAIAGVHAVDVNHTKDPAEIIKPDGSNYLPVETLTGNNRTIYAIANYEANVMEGFKSVDTEAQLKEVIAIITANPIFREFGITKVGKLTNQQIRKGTPIAMSLDFLPAKITINVENNNPDFEVESWTVGNIPKSTYLIERSKNATDPNYHDSPNLAEDNDYYNEFTNQRFDFETVASNKYSSVFYMVENRQGGRIIRAAPEGETRLDYQLKAWYAPARASYIKIYGVLNTDNVEKHVTITHYLGSNNTDNYDVERSTHYTHTVKINTLNNITIDTNVEIDPAHNHTQAPSQLMNMDGHSDSRIISIGLEEITDKDIVAQIEVVQAVNSNVFADWLDLSVTPLIIHQVASSAHSTWQQGGGANGSFVRTKFIPKKSVRASLGASYVPPSGVVIGSADYPDDDTNLPFEKAIRRMCKRITNLPTGGTEPYKIDAPLNISLYAEEYPFNASPTAPAYREAVVRVYIENPKTGFYEYEHFTVRQYPPHRYMKAPYNDTYTLLVERVEEYEYMLEPHIALNRQMLAGIQWGPFNVGFASDRKDGYNNTLYGVYAAGPNATAPRTAAKYTAAKYGSEGAAWSFANNGRITEPYVGAVDGGTIFNFPVVSGNNFVHTIYNTSAARYCHEKNWDTNGDGNIDPSETHWYLPSTLELQQFWTLHELLELQPDYYWSSNQADANHAYAFSMLSAQNDADHAFNGTPQPFPKSGLHSVNRPRVRCVRRAPGVVTPVAPLIRQLPNKNLAIDCSNLDGSVYTTTSKMGIEQSQIGTIERANRLIYKKLELSPIQPPVTDYYALHSGKGLCDQTKGWRLPTQREMLLIWAVRDKLEAYSSTVSAHFVDDKYWTMTRGLRSRYLVDFSTGLCELEDFTDTSTPRTHPYRCVRELP